LKQSGSSILFSLLICLFSFCAQASEFVVGTVRAQEGNSASGFLEVPRGSDEGTTIPISIFHGARPGPVLALIAGTHGYEYSPMIALQRLQSQIDPKTLSGTVIMVHVANMPSFLKRTIYYSPVDGKNLNRMYPGKQDGTVSERIAHVITREVIERSDYLADLHCGDGNESLRPYSYWMKIDNPDVDEKSKQLALAFGLDHIVIDTSMPRDPAASVYCSNTAATRGKPAITTESGALGQTDEASIERIVRGCFSMMRHLKMIEGSPEMVEHPVWIDQSEVLRSEVTGLFYPLVERGHNVSKGALLGYVTDFFGKRISALRSPLDGEVLYVLGTPPVSKGEPLAYVGHIQR
jgi:predicted deacylase